MRNINNYDDTAFEVEFMSCVIDKADNLRVLESDGHFSEFTGVHPSKIRQGKLSLLDTLLSKDREAVMKQLCKKHSPYVYLDFYMKNKDNNYIYVHCIAQSIKGTKQSRLTLADVSQSARKSELLKRRADSMNRLIDLVEGGVCLFKVTQDMHFKVLYMNKACARFFGTAKDAPIGLEYRLDELIHPEDKSAVYQAIGNSMATKKPIDTELRVMTHRDSFIWCQLNSAIQRYDDDGCPVFHAVFTDITKIKAAEQEADSERDLMITVFKNLPGPLFFTALDTPFLAEVVSKDFIHLIGYSRSEFFEELGGDVSKLIVDKTEKELKSELLAQAATSHIMMLRYQIRTKSGRLLDVVDRRRIVKDENGAASAIGMLKDPTATQMSDDITL